MFRIRLLWMAALAALTVSGCSCGGDDPPSCDTTICGAHQLCSSGVCAPACEAGYAWNGSACEASATATCQAAPAPGSIALRCEMENRTCAEATPGQAECTTCLASHVEVAGACELRQTCTELACSAQNRRCEAEPNGRCTGCLDGFVEDGTICRAPTTCDDTMCMPGFTCVDGGGRDAECRMGTCGADEVPSATGGRCVRCILSCDGRPGGTGNIYQTSATLADTCVCETEPGYFWDEGAAGGGDIRPCDADGDGWVRLTARRALEELNDPALRVNARCELRRIDRVRLDNDEGQQRDILLPQQVSLYEPERLDDQELLADAITQGSLPMYQGRALAAEELNTLTKACVWKSTQEQAADFNQNGVEDVDEAHLDPRLDDANDPLSPLYDFTYFIELDRGWYEGDGPVGRYVIREKRRSAAEPDEGQRLSLAYDPGDGGEHWRRCERARDAAYQPAQPGYDFGAQDDPLVWNGMGHHSQFRCLRIVPSPTGASNEAAPAELDAAWTLNGCTAGGTNPPVGGAVNPSDPALNCVVTAAPDPRTSTTAPVMLAAAKYLPYDDEFTSYGRPAYVRGCINTCAEHPARCPGYDPGAATNRAQCVGEPTDFGRLGCGCGRGFAGADCELSCAGDLVSAASDGVGHLFTSADLTLAPRGGTWLCGSIVAAASDPLTAQVGGSTVTWSLRGEVPAAETIPTDELCAPVDGGTADGGTPDGGCAWRVRPATF